MANQVSVHLDKPIPDNIKTLWEDNQELDLYGRAPTVHRIRQTIYTCDG